MCRSGTVKKIYHRLRHSVKIRKSGSLCRTAGIALLVVTVALQIASRTRKDFATWYSNHVYSALLEIIGRIFAVIPFPVAELMFYMTALFLIVYTIRY